jgi:hypothetical protein
VAEPDASQKKGDKSPRPWVLKMTTWLEVRPFQWKLAEKERLTMARNARMAFKTLRIPESDPAWDNVTYRSTTNTTPTSNSAAGVSSSKSTTANATPGGPSSSSKLEAKRGVMSKDIKEKKAKVKAEGQKQKTEVHMKDEGAKASKAAAAAAAASTKGKEPAESPASRSSASHSQAPVKKHPGSASKPVKQSSAQDGVETPTRPSTPAAPKESHSKPPSTASIQHTHERKSSAMRISKTTIPIDKDKEKDKLKADEKHTPPVTTTTTMTTNTSVKRKKLTREETELDDDALRKANLQKKRKTEDGALSVSASSTSSKDPRARELSLAKKTSTDISPTSRPKTVAGSAATTPVPSPLSSAARLPPTSSTLVPSSFFSSSKPRVQSDKDRPQKANGTSKPRRRSPIYTSSEDEGEIPQSQPHHPHPHTHTPSSSSLLPDFISNPRPRPPLPPAWDHVALRKRYGSSYQEYITVFSLMIAQKCQIESMLKSDSDMESGGGVELLESKELAKVASHQHSLKDELESIKSIFLTGKLPGEVSPRSD